MCYLILFLRCYRVQIQNTYSRYFVEHWIRRERRVVKKNLSISYSRDFGKYILLLLITFSGLAKVAIFTTNVDAENQTLINHKCVCGALNRHFCQTRVMRSAFYFFLIFDIVCPMDFVGLSISLIAKSIAAFINAFTLGFL